MSLDPFVPASSKAKSKNVVNTKPLLTAILFCLILPGAVACAPGLDWYVKAWKSTPSMQVQDAYKWLFQANMGGEHAVSDPEGARAWLDREWNGLRKPDPGEKLIVALRPDGRLVRLNLAVAKAQGISEEAVLAAFLASANEFRADKTGFIKQWQLLGERLKKRRIMQITFEDWQELDTRMKKAGYPAVSHTEVYARAYHPAYRVILSKHIKREWRLRPSSP
ncbi:MAG: hypothetical protein IT209_00360 [Armatimonadetes bacterium]|nr:hypothetical protein [Armatimonadota bacterium]